MKLYYRHLGQGYPVLILHGLFGMSDNWWSIAGKLAPMHAVYLIDQRNHGRSPHDAKFNFEVLVEDLKDFIDQQELGEVSLVGHSLGGKVAMLFALQYPEYLNKLVIVDIAPRRYKNDFFKSLLADLISLDMNQAASYTEASELLKTKISNPQIQQFLLKNLYKDDDNRFRWRLNLDSLHNNMDAILTDEGFTGEYYGDCLFIRGELSDYIQDADQDLIRQIFPEAVIKTIPGATHWVHSDAPDELCDLLKEYL